MEKIELQILGISSGHTATSYTLILEEKGGNRKLPIIIGAFEAQAIAIEIEKIVPVRPMTHDLFKAFAQTYNVQVKEVVIHRLHEGIFYAHIICTDGTTEHAIDARTSDAIALGLRFKCPLFTYESILQEAGIILSDIDPASEAEPPTRKPSASSSKSKSSEAEIPDKPLDELKKMLEEAIDVENYILAAKIRDEIKRRESGEKDSKGDNS